MATIAQIQALRERLVEQRREAYAAVAAGTAKVSVDIQKIDAALLKGAFAAGTVGAVIARYIAVRDEKEAVVKRQKLEVADFNDQLNEIERWGMDYLAKTKTSSASDKASGTMYTKNESKVRVEDPTAFFGWIVDSVAETVLKSLAAQGVTLAADALRAAGAAARSAAPTDMLEARCSKLAAEAYLESTGELPPGVSRRVEQAISFNRPSAK